MLYEEVSSVENQENIFLEIRKKTDIKKNPPPATFLGWVFQFAGEMIILSPEPVREMYSQMLTTASQEMAAGEFE